jgi:hypothetical protein
MSQQACPQCGAINRLTAKFCSGCGAAQHPGQPASGQPLGISPSGTFLSPGYGTGRLPPQAMLANRYIVIRPVGQGGGGAVYQAMDTRITNHICAIKEMSDAALTNSAEKRQAVAAFQQEADLLAKLTHPNLPRVTDRFADGERHYLVMEFIQGETFQSKLERGEGPFPETLVIQWAVQLCDVLSYLHGQNPPIIFRDLKPGNIMLDGNGRLKLIDMGIVRFFQPGKNKDTTLLGTTGYAPPEQYGSAQTDIRSDVYSLGATLFCLVTGRDPAEFPPYQLLPTAQQINPAVSTQLSQIISRAVQMNPNQRWQSMAALRSALTGTPVPQAVPQKSGGSYYQQAGPHQQAPTKTARPTTRLLLQAARLSDRQLVTAGLVILAVLVVGTWLLAPTLQRIAWFWENVPMIALVAPLAYAATRRRWAVTVSQAVAAMMGGAILWSRIGFAGANYTGLILGAVGSALAMEGMVAYLPKLIGSRQRDDPGTWQREMGWLALAAIVGHIILSGLATTAAFALNPLAWISAAGLGALGWFFGDFVQGYIYLKQTGVNWRRR